MNNDNSKARFVSGDAVVVGGCRATIAHEIPQSMNDGLVSPRAYRVRVLNLAGPDTFEFVFESDIVALLGVSTSTVLEIPAALDGRVFGVLLARMASAQSALEALTKRYARKGLTMPAWAWGKAYSRREHTSRDHGCDGLPGCMGCRTISRVPLTLTGEAPRYAGWTFLAALTHLDGENLVRTVVGQDTPNMYRTRGPQCDHCHTHRRRSETYVLRHDGGGTKQVGSTCIEDFLGADKAGDIAAHATMLALARGIAEGGCEDMGFGAASSGDRTLAEFLPIVAWCVRAQGWVSRTAARESSDCGEATADRAMVYINDHEASSKAGCVPSAEDTAEAAAAEGWAEALTDEEVDGEKGDYLHNLRAVARTGLVTGKSAGIAASMVTAYQRYVAKERARAERALRPNLDEYVGTVGKRQTWDMLTLDFVTGYEGAYGYTTVLKFRTAEGATLVWKASNTGIGRADVGKRFSVKGTVKAHAEYKGAKQTMITRCAVTEIK